MLGKILITVLMLNHIEEIFNKSVCKNKQLVDLSCPNDLCSMNTANTTRNSMNCYCDAECAFYGDCCNDIKQDSEEEYEFGGISCEMFELESTQFIYIINKCSKQSKDHTAKYECEEDRNNSFLISPVTNTETMRTYKNYKCAICNGEYVNTLEPWKTKIMCQLQGLNYRLSSLNEAISKNILKHDPQQNEWYLEINHEKYFCQTTYEVDIDTNNLRSCKKYIDTCSEKWGKNSIRTKCKQYTAFRYHNNDIYKNIHCASCNFIPLKNLSCVKLNDFHEISYDTSYIQNSDEGLFSITSAPKRQQCNVPQSSYSCMYAPFNSEKCDLGFIYNPNFKCCITCDSLHHMENYECVL